MALLWCLLQVLLALWTLALPTSSLPTSRVPRLESLSGQIDELAQRLLQCRRIPGLTMAVVKLTGRGQPSEVVTKSFGFADVGSGRRVGLSTRFCVAGVTQSFTAAVLAQLLHENQTFHLDTPVREIAGSGFKLSDPLLSQLVTVRDILSHSVGIAPYFGGFVLGYNLTRAEVIRRLRYIPSVAPFRKSFIPGPLLYVLAGQMVQALNDSTWEHAIIKRILKPLEMTSTTFADKVPNWAADFAIPHVLQEGQHVPILSKISGNILRPVGPSGSICSTAGDMAQWMLLLLNNGSNGQHQIFDNEVIDELFTPQNFHFPEIGRMVRGKLPVEASTVAYNFGWITGSYRGRRRYYQNAFSNYYGSFLTLLPEEGLGIFTAANGPSLAAMDNTFRVLHYYITDLVLGENPWIDLQSTACTFPRPWFGPAVNHTKQKYSTTQRPVKKKKVTLSTHTTMSVSFSDISGSDFTEDGVLETLSTMAPTSTPVPFENELKLTSLSGRSSDIELPNIVSSTVSSELFDVNNDITESFVTERETAKTSDDDEYLGSSSTLTVGNYEKSTVPMFTTKQKLSVSTNTDKQRKPTTVTLPTTVDTTTDVAVDTTKDEDYDVFLQTTPFEIYRLENFTKSSSSKTVNVAVTSAMPKTTSSHHYKSKLKFKRPTTTVRTTPQNRKSSFTKSTMHDMVTSVQEILGLHNTTVFSSSTVGHSATKVGATESTRSAPTVYANNIRHRFRRPLINDHRTRIKYPPLRPIMTTATSANSVSKSALNSVRYLTPRQKPILTRLTTETSAPSESKGDFGLRISANAKDDSLTATTMLESILEKMSSSISSSFMTTPKLTAATEGGKRKLFKQTKSSIFTIPFHQTEVTSDMTSDASTDENVSTAAKIYNSSPTESTTAMSENEMMTRLLNYSKAISNLNTTYIDGETTAITLETSTSSQSMVKNITLLDEYIQDALELLSSTPSSASAETSEQQYNESLTTQLVNMILDALTSSKTDSSVNSNEASVVEHLPTEWTTPTSKITKTESMESRMATTATPVQTNNEVKPKTETIMASLPTFSIISTMQTSSMPSILTLRTSSALSSLSPDFNTISRLPLSFLQFFSTTPKIMSKAETSTQSPTPVYTPSRRFPIPSRRRLSSRQRTLKVNQEDVTDVMLHLGSRVMQQNSRRVKRNITEANPFPKHVGVYSHQFFGNLAIFFNRTSGTLQIEYGFYGKAHLLPQDDGNTFKLRFFSAIWYASESDDTKRWPRKVFLVHFKRTSPDSVPSSIVIPLFEPRIPPVFIRSENF